MLVSHLGAGFKSCPVCTKLNTKFLPYSTYAKVKMLKWKGLNLRSFSNLLMQSSGLMQMTFRCILIKVFTDRFVSLFKPSADIIQKQCSKDLIRIDSTQWIFLLINCFACPLLFFSEFYNPFLPPTSSYIFFISTWASVPP